MSTIQTINNGETFLSIRTKMNSNFSALNSSKAETSALGDDPNFATTMTNLLAMKAGLTGGNTFSGTQVIVGTGKMLTIGDNASLYDINSANCIALKGEQDSSIGKLQLGNSAYIQGNADGSMLINGEYINPDFYKYSLVRSVKNLIVNNSFETNLTSWSIYGGATNARVTSQFYNGVASMQIVTTNSSQGTQINQGGLVVGEKYVFSIYAKGNVGGENFNIYPSTSSIGTDTWTLTNSWVRYSVAFIATGTSHIIYPRNMSGSATTFFIDAVQLEGGISVATNFTTTQGNMQIALKNYEGNDPTVAKPIKVQIEGVVRIITSACSFTVNAGTNYFNSGGSELATKEIDYFVYFYFSGGDVRLGVSRYPSANLIGDFDQTWFDKDKFFSGNWSAGATDPFINIGRFNAILSAGAGYTWSIPTTSVIINSPILQTRRLTAFSTFTGFSSNPGYTHYYTIIGDKCFLEIDHTSNGTSNSVYFTFTNPFQINGTRLTPMIGINNGVTTSGWSQIAANITTCYPDSNLGGWISSGAKRTYGWNCLFSI